MKNWKKLISGVVAMMTVATVASAAPAKLPVEVLDVADATGIEIQSYTVDNGDGTGTEYAYDSAYTQAAADNEGTWSLTTGSNSSKGNVWCGKVYTNGNGNGVTVYRGTGTRHRQLSAGYTTNKTYDYADTMVQFSFGADNFDDGRSQIIQVSSDEIMETQPVYANFEDETVNPGANYFNYNYDGAVIRVSADGIQYLDPEKNELVTVDINLDKKKIYSFRIVRVSGTATYDLYVDDVKIGVNSEPVATDIPLVAPKGNSINTVKMWVGGSTVAPFDYKASLSDIRFMQSASDKPVKEEFVKETFDTLPTEGWVNDNSSGNGSIGISADNSLVVSHKTNTGKTRNISATYSVETVKELDEFEVSFDFVPNYALDSYIGYISLAAVIDKENASTAENAPSGTYTTKDSLQLVMARGAKEEDVFLYGSTSEGVNSFKEIEGVAYEKGKKYYAKIAVNNIYKTYSLWLSQTPILLTDKPVIENAEFFCPSGKGYIPYQLQFMVRKNVSDYVEGHMLVDNLVYSESSDFVCCEHFYSRPSSIGSYDAKGNATVSVDCNAKIAYNTSSTSIKAPWVWYTNEDVLGLDKYEMMFEFTPSYTSDVFVESVYVTTATPSASTETISKPEMVADIVAYTDSIHILLANSNLYYGSSNKSVHEYKLIPGISYENGKTYYAKLVIDNVSKKYDMYLSTEKITDETEPVIRDEGFFLDSGSAAKIGRLGVIVNKNSGNGTGEISFDTIVCKDLAPSVEIPTDFAIMNDDQQYMTALGTSAYIDLINVPTDKEVIVAYYDAEGKLVDVAVATGDSLRAKKTDETAVSALVMTWDDFDNIVPANAAIELK